MWCTYIYICTHTCTYNGLLFRHKREQNNAICSNMDTTEIIKISKPHRERRISSDSPSVWNLRKMKQASLQKRNRIITKGIGSGGGGDTNKEFEINMYILLYIK